LPSIVRMHHTADYVMKLPCQPGRSSARDLHREARSANPPIAERHYQPAAPKKKHHRHHHRLVLQPFSATTLVAIRCFASYGRPISRFILPLAPRPTLLRHTANSSLSTRIPTTPLLSLHQCRPYSSETDNAMTPAELQIASLLSSPDSPVSPTTSLLVRDVSGGCGSMYAIDIASTKFRGLSLLQQQRLVTRTLGDKVKEWHGVQIRTSVPAEGDN
jgi:BolA-like protein 3